MIRGDFVSGLSERELNSFVELQKEFDQVLFDKYMDYIGTPLYESEGIRRQGIEAGFKIVHIYPIYHQGWEMDDWGAIGEKDGKRYVLETSHGGLIMPTEPIKSLKRSLLSVLGFN